MHSLFIQFIDLTVFTYFISEPTEVALEKRQTDEEMEANGKQAENVFQT